MDTSNARRGMEYRTIFISDLHLGFRGCAAAFLLDFLRSVRCRRLYLVGDIFDIWEMQRRGLYWPDMHNDVVKAVLGMAAEGTEVIYIPGNHDELLREYCGSEVMGVRILRQALHRTADGRQLLVTHGDEFDVAVQASRFVARLGSRAYALLLRANYLLNAVRLRLGFPYWSLAGALKHKVKNAVQYIGSFEQAVVHEARRRQVDGLVCGHIHHAQIAEFDGVLYCNSGDWVESCTALAEHPDGSMEILEWAQHPVRVRAAAADARQAA